MGADLHSRYFVQGLDSCAMQYSSPAKIIILFIWSLAFVNTAFRHFCKDLSSISIQDGYWVGYVPTQTPNLFFYPCPPQYCRCTQNSSVGPERCVFKYTQSVPDLQCNSQREGKPVPWLNEQLHRALFLFAGLLCGSCRNNSGVSVLLNNCVSCSIKWVHLPCSSAW